MRSFVIPQQAASDYCPAVPRTVRVFGNSSGHAVLRLAEVLKEDPKLEDDHSDIFTDKTPKDGFPAKKK